MPDSFSDLRTAGGPNKPWVVGGVLALVVAIIGVALAAAYWSAHPAPEASDEVPATVTVTAQPQLRIDGSAELTMTELAGAWAATMPSHFAAATAPNAAV